MDETEEPGLILGRYKKIKTVKITQSKEIWLAVNKNFGEKAIIKIQPRMLLQKPRNRNILNEASYLQSLQGHIGIPLMIWSGCQDNELLLIVQQLGVTLQERFQECGNIFSLKTVCLLAFQIFDIIQNLHQKNLVFRNINPKAFQFGKGQKCLLLYINDMIECKWFRSKKTLMHIDQKRTVHGNKNIFWTQSHYESKDVSRKHDIESIILMLIYFLKGKLPWSQNFKEKSYEKIKKQGLFDVDIICEGIPNAFKQILVKTRELTFQEQPPYIWYRKRLQMLMKNKSLKNDQVFDWLLKKDHVQKLKVNKYIPSLRLQKDSQILRQIYEPHQENIDLDQINSKYGRIHGINESINNSRQIPLSVTEFPPVKKKKKNGCAIM